LLTPPDAKAALVLLAGGHGGLQIGGDGRLAWGSGNFLVRTRAQFAAQGLAVAVLDAPSDRQSPPFLQGWRQTPEHAADLQAVIAWLHANAHVPVWLVGTSRGTQSAAWAATQLVGTDAPDGIVLTSTILDDPRGRPVTAMPLERIRVPVLVVHHADDGCALCRYARVPALMDALTNAPRKSLVTITGGASRGDPCEAFAHHGYNGNEDDVVRQVVGWIVRP
jgi:pimeloyl-ACP methyl ester carboxylesterase